MHHPLAPARVVARTFPASDGDFAERVHELLQPALAPNPEDVCNVLETRLRDVYPWVRATVRMDLAGYRERVIYVFRDGSLGG